MSFYTFYAIASPARKPFVFLKSLTKRLIFLTPSMENFRIFSNPVGKILVFLKPTARIFEAAHENFRIPTGKILEFLKLV